MKAMVSSVLSSACDSLLDFFFFILASPSHNLSFLESKGKPLSLCPGSCGILMAVFPVAEHWMAFRSG
jgi:hypothetical protein